MAIRARGVSELKTLAAVRGGGIHSNERHVQHFQIACLELERSRRMRERQAAMHRVTTLDARLLEIEFLIGALQAELATPGAERRSGKPMAETSAAANTQRRTLRY